MVVRADTLEEVATLLEELARALRKLKLEGEGQEPEAAHSAASEGDRTAAFAEGRRVQMKSMDKYRGRTGIITGRRGEQFWYLKLDPRGRETTGPVIYKKETSLRLLD